VLIGLRSARKERELVRDWILGAFVPGKGLVGRHFWVVSLSEIGVLLAFSSRDGREQALPLTGRFVASRRRLLASDDLVCPERRRLLGACRGGQIRAGSGYDQRRVSMDKIALHEVAIGQI